MRHIKHTKDKLEAAVRNSTSYAGVLRQLGVRQTGGSQHHIKTKIAKLGIDINHFTSQSWSRGKRSTNRLNAKTVLVVDRYHGKRTEAKYLRNALIEIGRQYVCSMQDCSIDSWHGRLIVLQVDHIDGNPLNNMAENLRFLCPNCHSQTENFGVKNTAR